MGMDRNPESIQEKGGVLVASMVKERRKSAEKGITKGLLLFTYINPSRIKRNEINPRKVGNPER